MLLCQQKEAEDHQGAVLITALDCGSQSCLCGYRGSLGDIRALGGSVLTEASDKKESG